MPAFAKIFKRKPSLLKLSPSELRQEEMRLEIRENQLLGQLKKFEEEKDSVFEQGAKNRSAPRRRFYARRFNDLAQRASVVDRELARVSKELVTLGRIRSVIERAKGQPQTASAILGSLDETRLGEIQCLLEDDKVSLDLYLEKLDGVLRVASDPAYEMRDVGAAGLEVLKTWEAMDEGELGKEEALRQFDRKEKTAEREVPSVANAKNTAEEIR